VSPFLVAAGACALLALPAAASGAQNFSVTKSKVIRSGSEAPLASASKKKGKKPINKTATSQVAFASGTTAGATASCPGKTHITGGGFAVAPGHTPAANSGLRSQTVISHPSGAKDWTASGGAFTTPPATGSFTTFARCENSALGRLVSTISISGTVAASSSTTALLDCPGGTHVIGGGYSGTGLANLVNINGTRTIILESRRSAVGQWSVAAYTATGAPASPFTAFAICERNGKGTSVSEVSTLAAIGENVRSAADASCTGKKHVVSGGFSVTDGDPALVPAAGIDENHPSGSKGWHVGMYEFSLTLPAGSALQTFAYCKKNSPAKSKNK